MKKRFRSLVDSAAALVMIGSTTGLVGVALSATILHAQVEHVQAQFEVPPITWKHDARRTVTAPEAAYHVDLEQARLGAGYSFHDDIPMDSILQKVSAHAATWVTELQKRPIKGLQLDPAGRVNVFAKNEKTAQQQIAERLATPGLSLADRAYTYAVAVQGFSDWRYSDRLPIAEEYMKELTKLGAAAGPWQLQALNILVETYKMLGQSDAVLRHGMAAVKLLPSMAYDAQLAGFNVAIETLDAISGMPDVQARIDTMDAILKATVHPPAALLVQDSAGVLRIESIKENRYHTWSVSRALLGQIGKPLVAHYWVNRGSTDSASIPVNDGKIRIVEIFSWGCSGCVAEMSSLERIKKRNPYVEVIGLTWTFGSWGNRNVESKEEAKLLGEQLATKKKFTLPIGIWYSKFEGGDYGYEGIRAWTGGNYDNYPMVGKASFFILDGKGRIRRVGSFGGIEGEIQMERTVQFLHKEAVSAQASSSVSPSGSAVAAASPITTTVFSNEQ